MRRRRRSNHRCQVQPPQENSPTPGPRSLNLNTSDHTSRPPRPITVTVLAWIVIVASALGCLISAVTCLMFIAGSHGTSGGLTLEGLAIIAGPPATLFAGISLLRRQRWALFYILALPCAVLAASTPPPCPTSGRSTSSASSRSSRPRASEGLGCWWRVDGVPLGPEPGQARPRRRHPPARLGAGC